ncbi:S8 family serine peptidase [Streptomyces sp. NPDC051569]|uniref:S8 family serine peptidase n=1 Tax=Streptomyces sp. NPDC051569 TaxID=3365661 RepID=UPI003796ED04
MPSIPRSGLRLTALATAAALLSMVPAASASDTSSGIRSGAALGAALGAAPVAAASGKPRTLTLITGDRVTVTGGAGGAVNASVTDPQGRQVPVYRTTEDGDTYIYPLHAMRYVSAGVLDKALFNVTKLLADGYDDTHTDRLPLIVTYGSKAKGAQAVPKGATRTRTLSSINGAALSTPHDRAADLWSSLTGGAATASGLADGGRAVPGLGSGIAKVWLDRKVKATLADTTAQIGASKVWAAGNTGKGVNVAILDTGMDVGHPDLTGKAVATADFTNVGGPGTGFRTGATAVTDRVGHGTHVASTVAGTGAASGGKEKGVAPSAGLIIGKVLDDTGAGPESSILAGMEWAARDQHAKIISMSLGAGPSDGSDPLSQAVNDLSAETGALFVIAAGNSGPSGQTVASPGTADAALTVGAVDGSDQLAGFSSRGPRFGDGAVKPEISAPGVDVLAARSQDSPGTGSYVTMSGTSMATPHVAGAAALLASAHPDWTGQEIKSALVSTSKKLPAIGAFGTGAGRLDAQAATAAGVFATGTVSAGVYQLPFAANATADRKVTYTNKSASPVTLDLAVDAPRAPRGLFTLSASRVTVPARGTAQVTVTTQLKAAAAAGNYDGQITASSAGAVLAHSAVAVAVEPAQRNVTIVTKDRSGKAVPALLRLQSGTGEGDTYFWSSAGPETVRLPDGPWAVSALVEVQGAHGQSSRGLALLTAPRVDLKGDTTLTLDARQAKKVTAATPKQSTTTQLRVDYRFMFDATGDAGAIYSGFTVGSSYDSLWALPTGKKVTGGSFEMRVRWRNEQPALKISSRYQDLDDLLVVRGRTPLRTGTKNEKAVFAGEGSAADYKRLKVSGQVAVVRRSASVTPAAQQAAAAKAGAKLLLVVNDGTGRLDLWDENAGSPPVTTASLGYDEGEQLIRRIRSGQDKLSVTSHATTDYLYDLVHIFDGAVPSDPTYRPRAKDLTRVNVSFRNYRQADAKDFRYDVWPGEGSLVGVGTELPRPAQGDRTDWVSNEGQVKWAEAATVIGEVRETAPARTYRNGTTVSNQWFSPIQRPRLTYPGNLGGSVFRFDNGLFAVVPGWGDAGAGREGWAVTPDVRQTTSYYLGNTLLGSSGETSSYVDGLGSDSRRYRIVSEQSRGKWKNPYSVKTRTEWTFNSAAGPQYKVVPLPLIQLDYAVDTDKAGKAARNGKLTLSASHMVGQPSSDTIRTATLDVSYDDGATWQKQQLTKVNGGWRASLKAPKKATFATIRATATDTQGNAVSQTVTRAFGLK